MTAAQFAITAAMILVTACSTTPAPRPSYVLVHGPAEVEGVSPAWCYATLADPDCFVIRRADATERLIGAYIPAASTDEPDAK